VGKTEIAVRLAGDLTGEIISADSRQVYRWMDIGTAKPTTEEVAKAPHHLIDFLDPDEDLSLAQFQSFAYAAIDAVTVAGKLPILVGGTGQYVRAVVEGWGIPEVPPHLRLRSDLEAFGETYGSTALYDWLKRIDPQAAGGIDWRNIRRVVRALEVYLVTGQPISVLQQRHPPPYRILMIGLTRPREELYRRVDQRIARMIELGLAEETDALIRKGYSWGLPSMSSLGYPEMGAYLRGEIPLEDAEAAVRRETRRFIRHQYNWFRLDDASIRWFDLSEAKYEEILATISGWLAARSA
jgi:tRNA dimethylallyltransferase